METITGIARGIVTIIFSEAFKEGGKRLGKSASDRISQLISNIHQRFKESGTEGLLARAQKQPTESNIARVETELITQMSDDEIFAGKIKELVKQLEQVGITRQVMVSGIKASNLEIKGDVTQRAIQKLSADQVMGNDLEIDGDVKFDGNFTQES